MHSIQFTISWVHSPFFGACDLIKFIYTVHTFFGMYYSISCMYIIKYVLVFMGQGEMNMQFDVWNRPLNEALPNIIKNGFQFFQNRVQVRCSNLSQQEGGKIILANAASHKQMNNN